MTKRGCSTHKVKPFHKSVKRGHDGGVVRVREDEGLAVGAISLVKAGPRAFGVGNDVCASRRSHQA